MKLKHVRTRFFSKAFILLGVLTACQVAKAKDETWKANWIWTSEQGPNNAWVDFRKKVNLSAKPTTAITRIAAENKYWLFVNDSLIIRDGGLETRPDLNNTYYDEIDLAPYLKAGITFYRYWFGTKVAPIATPNEHYPTEVSCLMLS